MIICVGFCLCIAHSSVCECVRACVCSSVCSSGTCAQSSFGKSIIPFVWPSVPASCQHACSYLRCNDSHYHIVIANTHLPSRRTCQNTPTFKYKICCSVGKRKVITGSEKWARRAFSLNASYIMALTKLLSFFPPDSVGKSIKKSGCLLSPAPY